MGVSPPPLQDAALPRRAFLALALAGLAGAAAPPRVRAQAGTPEAVRQELEQALAAAIESFNKLDAPAVLAHVSEQYRHGPVTKAAVREQLRALFTLYDEVRAQVRIDEVRLVDGAAWILSSGEIWGRVRGLGIWTAWLGWEREPDVARREDGRWRLVGPDQPAFTPDPSLQPRR